MRLLPIESFESVFGEYRDNGARLGLVDGDGNTGDRLIYSATRQIMLKFGLKWRTINILADPASSFRDEVDELLLFGGGAVGGWRPVQLMRQRALASGVPCTVLPSTWLAPETGAFRRQFVRESGSLRFCPSGILAPDLALGYDFHETRQPVKDRGVCLKSAGLHIFDTTRWPRTEPDPAKITYTAEDYIDHASGYQHIITDYLHFAIVGLGLGRRVTLLPYGCHKNWSMWCDWLRDLGCEWANRPEDV